MSLEMTIGAKGNLLSNDGAKDIPAVHIKSPVLFDEDVEAIMAIEELNTTHRRSLRRIRRCWRA